MYVNLFLSIISASVIVIVSNKYRPSCVSSRQLLQSLIAIMTLLIILLINAVTVLSTSVSINDSVTLEQYLCYNGIQSSTDLVISSSVVQYNVSIDSFCWIQNTEDIIRFKNTTS